MSGRPSARPKQSWSGVPAELLTYQALKQEAARLGVSPAGKKTDVMRRVVAARQAAGEQDLFMTDARLAELQQRSRNSRGISASAASPAQASNQGSLRPRTSRAQPGTPQVGSSVPAEDSPLPNSDNSDTQDEEEDTTEEEKTDDDEDIEPEWDEEELADDHQLDREAVRPTRRPSPRRRPSARSQQQQQGTAPKLAAVRRKGSQAKKTVEQTAQAAQRFARNLPWQWLLTALTLAALLGLGTLAWRHLPQHGGGLPHRLHAGVSSLWHGPSDATAATWDKLRHMVKVEGPGSVQCSRQMDHGVLDRLLPVSKLWDGAKVALKDVWSGHKDDATKAAGVLLVADSENSAAAAAKAVRSAGEAKCGRSILYLDMADWQRDLQRYPAGELAGRLQKQLATQMGRSAHSVIVIQGVHIAPLPLLGVLINALAEGGHFEQGGKQIATSDALFVATMWASPGTVSQASEKEFSSSAKDYLVDSLRQQAVDSETVTRQAMALRRTFLGALGGQTKEHQKVVHDMLASMEERDKRHEATTERLLKMILERTAPAPAAPRPQAAPPAGSTPGPSAAPGPSGAGPSAVPGPSGAPASAPVPRPPAPAPSHIGEKYRVYTDGKTHAECIVENCGAKVCSFKDPSHPAVRGKQGAFCVEHHNQLVDLKASGRYEMLSRFPTKVVCPHCLQGVTLKEAADQMHFTINYRPGTIDQLLISKPKTGKRKTFLGALGEQTKEHQKAVQDILTSMEERDKRHEAAMEGRDKRHEAATERRPGPRLHLLLAPLQGLQLYLALQGQGLRPYLALQKHRVYNDGKTHAECIVENGEAKICSCKDPCFKNPRHPTRTRGKPGPFCMEHHNQLVDLKACDGNKKLTQFPMKVVCPHCLEGVTLKEAAGQGHFTI
eukprot:jgi/Astpho2/925/Aster-00763